MAAGLIVPVSGAYVGTYRGNLLGTMNDDGFILTGTWHGQEVNASDVYGMTLVNAVYRGLDWRLSFTSLEFNYAGVRDILLTFNQASLAAGDGILSPILNRVGDTWITSATAVLVLTAILGNPPTRPQTLTASTAIIAPETNVQMLMTSKVRETPLEMALFPYQTSIGGTDYNVSFTTT